MINQNNIEILKNELNFNTDDKTKEKLNLWEDFFVEYNSHTNLMSKKDVDVLFEKHVFDSLAILKWKKFKNFKRILDVGTGGGFPGVILAICFPSVEIIANDSRIKKINFIKEIKEKLKLENLSVLYSRIEDAPKQNADLIVSRAVGKMINVYEDSKKHISSKGSFLIYKSKLKDEEMQTFKAKYKDAKFEVIPYKLPLKENYERNLIILKS